MEGDFLGLFRGEGPTRSIANMPYPDNRAILAVFNAEEDAPRGSIGGATKDLVARYLERVATAVRFAC